MSNTRREIECIARLQSLGQSMDTVLDFLLNEGLATKDDLKKIKLSPEPAKEIQLLLSRLSTSGKLQLLEYEWIILPVERMKIHIVTDKSSEEFSFGY